MTNPTIETWLPEARQMAAQCWRDDTTKNVDMNPALAEVVAYKIAAWMDTGAFHARNEAYWRERAEKAEAALDKIEVKAQAGLCYFTLESAREFLKDIRDEVADALGQERPQR